MGPPGKAVEYKQKRCINLARRGMLALSLEWFAFGELDPKGNGHRFGAQLEALVRRARERAGGLRVAAMAGGVALKAD